MDEQRRIKVLVVEDNPTQSNLLRMSLTRRGFDVDCAFSLAQALHRLPMGGIEVILLDLSLPDSEGIQTFYDVYTAAGGLPIVVLTGLNDQNVAYEALKGGAQDYLVKGVPTDESVIRCLRYAIQRQQFETELWQSERRTRLILENAQDAFFAIDESGRVISWNTQAEAMFGFLRKDALGEPLVGLIIPPAYRKEFNQEIRSFLQGQGGSIINNHAELNLRNKDGHEFIAEASFFSIAEGHSYMFCAFVRDISHRKQIDEQMTRQLLEQRVLDRMADLERSNNSLQKYNRTISEQLRRPLEELCEHALMMRDRLRHADDIESVAQVRAICELSERLLGLVRPMDDSETTIKHSAIMRATFQANPKS